MEHEREEKESIEEILSDLNNLLNKMPAILSDIQLPDVTTPKTDFIIEESGKEDKTVPNEIEKAVIENGTSAPNGENAGGEEYSKAVNGFQFHEGENSEVKVPDIDDLLNIARLESGNEEEKNSGGLMMEEERKETGDFENASKKDREEDETIIASPEDFKNMLSEQESTSGDDERKTDEEESAESVSAEGEAPEETGVVEEETPAGGEAPGEIKLEGEEVPAEEEMPGETRDEKYQAETGDEIPNEDRRKETLNLQQEALAVNAGTSRQDETKEEKKAEDSPGEGLELTLDKSAIESHESPMSRESDSENQEAEDSGDKTLVLEPGALREESKPKENMDSTFVIRPQDNPASQTESAAESAMAGEETPEDSVLDSPSRTTRKSYEGNVKDLINKEPPENIPPERIKPLVFMYASGDESLLGEVLHSMDNLCLKSPTKPMFVRRAAVDAVSSSLQGNYIHALVSEKSALGLVLVGDIPSEVLYDIQSVFETEHVFIRHVSAENYSYDYIVDIVSELVIL